MPYDASCSVYWCDQCGKMMDVDYERSNEFGVVLKCVGREPCDFRLFFVKTDEAAFEEVTRVLDTLDTDPAIPVATDAGGPCELDPGVLDRACHAEEGIAPEAGGDDEPVPDGTGGGELLEGRGRGIGPTGSRGLEYLKEDV